MRSVVVISAMIGAVFCRPNALDTPGGSGPPGGPGGPPGGPRGPGASCFFSIMKNNDTMAKKKADLLTWGQSNGVQVYHIIKLATAHLHPRELGLPHGPQNFATAVMDAPEEGNDFGAAVMDHEDPVQDDN
ncbi:hypothetical protein OSTOST_09789 [Ostertagia ostertagi]